MGIDEACRRHGVHRSTWYRWARESAAPATTDPKDGIRNRILAIAREHPTWGCDRIAFYLSFEGVAVSSPTVQKHLVALGLGKRCQRLAASAETAPETDTSRNEEIPPGMSRKRRDR